MSPLDIPWDVLKQLGEHDNYYFSDRDCEIFLDGVFYEFTAYGDGTWVLRSIFRYHPEKGAPWLSHVYIQKEEAVLAKR